MKKTAAVIEKIIHGLFAVILVYLLILAFFATASLNGREHTVIHADSLVRNGLVTVGFGALLCAGAFALRRFGGETDPLRKKDLLGKANTVLLVLQGLLALAFVLSTQRYARADQWLIADVADYWLKNDFESFSPGGYLDFYPFQAGIILLMYGLTVLLGSYNFMAFQLLNVVALLCFTKTMGDLAEDAAGKTEARTAVYCAVLLFLPLTLYTTFVYGTLIGLALSAAAFRQAVLFRKEKKAKHFALCLLWILLAVTVKQNYLIFAIGLMAWLLVGFLQDREKLLPALCAAMLAVLLLQGPLVRGIAGAVTGRQLGPGLSKWAYLQMGLSENGDLYDGWWNHYTTDSYRAAGFDLAKQEEQVKADLSARADELKANPGYAIRFFSAKNDSQWNNPDFNGLWTNSEMPEREVFKSPGWIRYLLHPDGAPKAHGFMNLMQTLILFGALLYLLLRGKQAHAFFYEIVVIGGFVFHTFWEAKGQYTLCYFVLLIPLAVCGWGELVRLALAGRDGWKQDRKRLIFAGAGLLGLAAFMAVIKIAHIPLLDSLFIHYVN